MTTALKPYIGTFAGRPASPVEGQRAYYTDGGYSSIYSGGQWYKEYRGFLCKEPVAADYPTHTNFTGGATLTDSNGTLVFERTGTAGLEITMAGKAIPNGAACSVRASVDCVNLEGSGGGLNVLPGIYMKHTASGAIANFYKYGIIVNGNAGSPPTFDSDWIVSQWSNPTTRTGVNGVIYQDASPDITAQMRISGGTVYFELGKLNRDFRSFTAVAAAVATYFPAGNPDEYGICMVTVGGGAGQCVGYFPLVETT